MSATLQLYILCYNRAELARQAIESALAQTDPHFQLVISDNSTDDATQRMVATHFPELEYRRRIPHLGVLDHMNTCLHDATAPHVCLFHDDDLLAPNFVERVLAAVDSHPEAAAIGVNAWVAEEGRPVRPSFIAIGREHVVHGARQLAAHYFGRYQMGIAPFPGYVYAKGLVAGMSFDTTGGKYSDVSWLLRVAERGPLVWLVEPLMTYRLHAANDSRTESIRDRLRLLAFFKRRSATVGVRVIDDFRFFIYKKLLDVSGGLERVPRRRQTMARYLSRYRCRRMGRLDQHRALLHRTWVRWVRRMAGPTRNDVERGE